jgi:hypothetical protein
LGAGLLATTTALAQVPDGAKTKWTTDGTKLWMENEKGEKQRLFLKGVCYGPAPIGGGDFQPGVGDWFYQNFAGIHDRDLPMMKAAGINHLRTYFWWPWEKTNNPNDRKDIPSHKSFLDACYKNGIYVTMGLAANPAQVMAGDNPQAMADYYVAVAKEIAKRYGNHPAVIGLSCGNEMNQGENFYRKEFWDRYGAMAKAFKQGAPDKITMVCWQDDRQKLLSDKVIPELNASIPDMYAKYFDVWGLNIYGNLPNAIDLFRKTVASKSAIARPLMITEFAIQTNKNSPDDAVGPDRGNATTRDLRDDEWVSAFADLNAQIKTMKDATDVIAGAEYFEWSDEWWKNKTTPIDIITLTDGEKDNVNKSVTGITWTQVSPINWWEKVRANQRVWEGTKGDKRVTNGSNLVYPAFVWRQDGGESPAWPEEAWGLYKIAPNGRGAKDPLQFNEQGYIYNVDKLTAKGPNTGTTAVDTLKAAYDTITNPLEKK